MIRGVTRALWMVGEAFTGESGRRNLLLLSLIFRVVKGVKKTNKKPLII